MIHSRVQGPCGFTKRELFGEIVNPNQEVYRNADGGLPSVSARAIVTSKFPRKSDSARPPVSRAQGQGHDIPTTPTRVVGG